MVEDILVRRFVVVFCVSSTGSATKLVTTCCEAILLEMTCSSLFMLTNSNWWCYQAVVVSCSERASPFRGLVRPPLLQTTPAVRVSVVQTRAPSCARLCVNETVSRLCPSMRARGGGSWSVGGALVD